LVSRRAVLGAAACLTLPSMGRGRGGVAVVADEGSESPHPMPESTPTLPSPIKGEGIWSNALAAFREAQAALFAVERATAGRSVEDEEAWLPAHEAACDTMEGALARAIAAPAPDLAAFAVKLDLLFAYGVEPGAIEEGVEEAIVTDCQRLLRV
jgi:hypothetical protein